MKKIIIYICFLIPKCLIFRRDKNNVFDKILIYLLINLRFLKCNNLELNNTILIYLTIYKIEVQFKF